MSKSCETLKKSMFWGPRKRHEIMWFSTPSTCNPQAPTPRKCYTYCVFVLSAFTAEGNFITSNIHVYITFPSTCELRKTEKTVYVSRFRALRTPLGSLSQDAPKIWNFVIFRYPTCNPQAPTPRKCYTYCVFVLSALLPKAISLLLTYMFTLLFLRYANSEKRENGIRMPFVFVPSGHWPLFFWIFLNRPWQNLRWAD